MSFTRLLQQIILVLALLYTGLGLLLPTMVFTSIIPAFYLFAMVMILYAWAMLFRAMGSNREGPSLILGRFHGDGGNRFNDML